MPPDETSPDTVGLPSPVLARMATVQPTPGLPIGAPDAKQPSHAKSLSDTTFTLVKSDSTVADMKADLAAAPPTTNIITTTTTEIPDPDAVPPEPPPDDGPKIQVRLNEDPSLGFCVYALRSIARHETVFKEFTALEATHDPDPRGQRNAYERYRNMSAARRNQMHGAFPYLAWANDVDAHEAAEARDLIGSRVTPSGRHIVDIALTAEDHMMMRPDVPFPEDMRTPSPAPKHRQHSKADLASTTATAPTHPLAESSTATATATATAMSTVKTTGTKTKAALSGIFRPIIRPGSTSERWRARRDRHHRSDETNSDFDDSKSHKSHRSYKSSRSHASVGSRLSQLSIQSRASQLHHHHHHHPHGKHNPAKARDDTLAWFSRYAFRLKPSAAFGKAGGHHQAAVYLLTDLINHRCAGHQNCRVSAEVGKISVIALRDISVGEELTIDYSKSKKDFKCKGECCRE